MYDYIHNPCNMQHIYCHFVRCNSLHFIIVGLLIRLSKKSYTRKICFFCKWDFEMKYNTVYQSLMNSNALGFCTVRTVLQTHLSVNLLVILKYAEKTIDMKICTNFPFVLTYWIRESQTSHLKQIKKRMCLLILTMSNLQINLEMCSGIPNQ